MKHRGKYTATAVLTILILIAAAGCSGDPGVSQSSSVTESVPSGEEDCLFLEGDEGLTDEEIAAAQEAIDYACDANIGSEFRAREISLSRGWARVGVVAVGVPAEESVEFDIYLERLEDGTWEVAEAGTGVEPDDIPGAPEEIFDS